MWPRPIVSPSGRLRGRLIALSAARRRAIDVFIAGILDKRTETQSTSGTSPASPAILASTTRARRRLAPACRAWASIWPKATDCRSRSCPRRRPESIGPGAASRNGWSSSSASTGRRRLTGDRRKSTRSRRCVRCKFKVFAPRETGAKTAGFEGCLTITTPM